MFDCLCKIKFACLVVDVGSFEVQACGWNSYGALIIKNQIWSSDYIHINHFYPLEIIDDLNDFLC